VSTTVDQAGGRGLAERLGIEPGMVVQELGYDEDVDHELRDAIEERSGNEMVDEDADDVVDVVLLWWREDDGDLVDALVDALRPLGDSGLIWLLTPKSGRDGHVPPSDITEAAPTAGLSQTSSISAGGDWAGARLVTPKSGRPAKR
jgi:hypothetical protein